MFVITARSVHAGRLRNGSAPINFECKAEKKNYVSSIMDRRKMLKGKRCEHLKMYLRQMN